MYVCICNSVTDRQIREARESGVRSLEALGRKLKVATCCGRCADCAKRILCESPSEPIAVSFTGNNLVPA